MPSKKWRASKPSDDVDYFERMCRALFQAGLNWKMIENKWPNFEKAFSKFSIGKVSRFDGKAVKRLMTDTGIVRNERKIRATVHNAQQFLAIAKQYGSFEKYLYSFDNDENELISDLEKRFKRLGKSTSRMFLYMSGYKLKPTKEETAWHSRNAKNK